MMEPVMDDDFTVFDDYEWTKEMTNSAKEMLQRNSNCSMSQLDSGRLLFGIPKYWDLFYRHNRDKFFKQRFYLHKDFPELVELASRGDKFALLEFGCGTGASIFPLIETFPTLHVTGVDLSTTAIHLVQSNSLYESSRRVTAFVHDASAIDLTIKIQEALNDADPKFDFVLCIFMLSAMPQPTHLSILKQAHGLLKPGGRLLFRDYGRYDAAEMRFKPNRKIKVQAKGGVGDTDGENHFFARSDGTLAYFFSVDELSRVAQSIGFEITKCAYLHRKFCNRATNKFLYRVWVHAVFVKR
jgi:tRNAThr (cytosine32-N3)-methyltransferase